jgi:predicted RND superfamily exporter protein
MLKRLSHLPVMFPRSAILIVLALTVLALTQMGKLRWETDARVYFPPGHPAIQFDEMVADVFHVKDSVIIAIVNEEGIFNPETIARVARITDKASQLPGALAQRRVDVASLASATVFVGTEDELLNVALLENPQPSAEDVARMKELVYDNASLFVGNLVSADGKATMIRVKLKEGIEHRYQTYFQVRAMIMEELRGNASTTWGAGDSGWGGGWQGSEQQSGGEQDSWGGEGGWGADSWEQWDRALYEQVADNGDRFFMAGRPVIEVTSGQHALSDLKVMLPLLGLAICVVLFILFRTLRGVFLPLAVVAIAVVWTAGAMAAAGIPMYTISTMLPVILIAVGIADALHVLTHFEDLVIADAQRDAPTLVRQLMDDLNPPLMITTLTTAVGFMSLWWAEMPPFKIFGLFTAIGIIFCWLVSIVFVPAMLSLMRPHVSGYLAHRRALRVHNESGVLARVLVRSARSMMKHRAAVTVVVLGLVVAFGIGAQRLYVDSSWMGDFLDDSEVVVSNDLLNEKFDGTIFLNVVVDGGEPDALKSPELLKRLEDMVGYVESLPHVGGSVSLVDFVKTANRSLHANDPAYEILPQTQAEVGEFLFLLSVSGRPELLDEIVNYDYSVANLTFAINTDHTQDLKAIIDATRAWADRELAEFGVKVGYAGSANNSYVWAEMLINSQVLAILLSKIGILLMAALLYRSLAAGLLTVIPITVSTAIVAGAAGWLRIPMDVSTVLAAGVAIGVGVDYTVHYISRYMLERRRGSDEQESVLGAMRSVGKPIVFNAVVVTAGFLILGLSQFPPHIKLGYFVATYMVIASSIALIVLPVALCWLRPRLRGGVAGEAAAGGIRQAS